MKSSNQELKELIPSLKIEKSIICYIPPLISALLLSSTALLFFLSLIHSSPLLLEDLLQTSPMSIVLFSSTVPGFFTVFSFHFFISSKLTSNDSIFYLLFSLISGTLSQTLLLFISLTSAEQLFLSFSFITEAHSFALGLYMVSSLVFDTISLNLLLEFGGALAQKQKGWVCIKIALVGVLLFASFFQGAVCVLLQVNSDESILRLVYESGQYVLFFIHLLYFATFCYDLQDIKLSLSLKQDYQDSVNSSTF